VTALFDLTGLPSDRPDHSGHRIDPRHRCGPGRRTRAGRGDRHPAWARALRGRARPGVAAWRDVLDTNLTAAFALAQRVARGMLDRGNGKDHQHLLGAVRPGAGLDGCRCGGQGGAGLAGPGPVLRLGAVRDPGERAGAGIHTHRPERPPGDRRRVAIWWLGLIPAGRFGTQEDLGGTLVWLASSAADYVNGQVIFVDGGMTAIV
jgi:gluconate 5-dehydrogenase